MVANRVLCFATLVACAMVTNSAFAGEMAAGGFLSADMFKNIKPAKPAPGRPVPLPDGEGRKPFNYVDIPGLRKKNLVQIKCDPDAGYRTHFEEDKECKPVNMNRALADFFNSHFNRCIDKAGNNAYGHGTFTAHLGSSGNIIQHDGCIGDHAHQQTGSWHNEGLAFDIIAIKLGTTNLAYADALLAHDKNPVNAAKGRRAASFWGHFRKCWSDAVLAYGPSCNRGSEAKERVIQNRVGSRGNEQENHQTHLHLSLPCKSVSNGRSTLSADIWDLFFPKAFAAEAVNEVSPPESSFFTSQLRTGSGPVEISIEDRHGESVGRHTYISLSQTCASSGETFVFEKGIPSCAFDGLKDAGGGKVELRYRTARMLNGAVSCSVPRIQTIALPCAP